MIIESICEHCDCGEAEKLNCFASRDQNMCIMQVRCENCHTIYIVQIEWGTAPCLHKSSRCDSEDLVFH